MLKGNKKLNFSLIVYNSILKTYKIIIDESCEETFINFILNVHFCSAIFKKSQIEEFYVKDNSNIFYHFKINALTFLILFDKDTTSDDVNNVKVTLKSFSEIFDNKENYNESKK
jgi:hypothetical protein